MTTTIVDLLHLPDPDGLTDQQTRGTTCVWDGTPLTTTTAIDLGERTAADGTSWFPRACQPCARRRVMQALSEHECTECVGTNLCEAAQALIRLAREARR